MATYNGEADYWGSDATESLGNEGDAYDYLSRSVDLTDWPGDQRTHEDWKQMRDHSHVERVQAAQHRHEQTMQEDQQSHESRSGFSKWFFGKL